MIDPISSAANSPADSGVFSRLPVKTLNQDDFLKLLVTQMTSQDPLNPKQDTEFIAQMTQFSALEQTKSMQSDIARMRGEQQLIQANSLIGRAVELDAGGSAPQTGVVTAVQVEEGTPKIVVNDQVFDLDQLISITPALTA